MNTLPFLHINNIWFPSYKIANAVGSKLHTANTETRRIPATFYKSKMYRSLITSSSKEITINFVNETKQNGTIAVLLPAPRIRMDNICEHVQKMLPD
jgi:hypothetical protein